MENRERDRVSQRNASTETGQSNRRVEEEKERQNKSGTGEFGSTSGRPENLEGGSMNDNKRNDRKDVNEKNMENEPSRRSSGSDYSSSTGRRGSIDNIERSDLDRNSDLESDVSSSRRGSKGEFGSTGEGRH